MHQSNHCKECIPWHKVLSSGSTTPRASASSPRLTAAKTSSLTSPRFRATASSRWPRTRRFRSTSSPAPRASRQRTSSASTTDRRSAAVKKPGQPGFFAFTAAARAPHALRLCGLRTRAAVGWISAAHPPHSHAWPWLRMSDARLRRLSDLRLRCAGRRALESPPFNAGKHMTRHDGPIGVFDSGIGGLTVVRALMDRLPFEDIAYFGDTARVPYGIKSVDTIRRFTGEITQFLLQRDVKMLIVACNTMAAVASDVVRELARDVPVVDVIEAGSQAALAQSVARHIGVIGTLTTINSNAYALRMHALDPTVQVYSSACPLFVPLVEEGWLDHP